MAAIKSDPWLVIVDMQTIFSDGIWRCPRFNEVIAPIRKLAEKYAGRTLLTRFVATQQPDGSWATYYASPWFSFAAVPSSDPLYDIVPPLADLQRGDNVVTMTTFNKWDSIREKTGPTPHLIVTGVATDCCVLSTAISAAEAGAFVTVALDACAGSSDANQAAAANIFYGYVPLIDVKNWQNLL